MKNIQVKMASLALGICALAFSTVHAQTTAPSGKAKLKETVKTTAPATTVVTTEGITTTHANVTPKRDAVMAPKPVATSSAILRSRID